MSQSKLKNLRQSSYVESSYLLSDLALGLLGFLGLLGLSEELWNNNPSFARSEEDPGRLLFRRSLVVHVYVESLKYTKARILHVPWSFFWVRYHRYVGRYHTVGSYTKYVGRYLLLCT